MKRITIYDVAKEADVSLATVSRVINDSSVVREDTRQRVQEVIEKLGYKPNAIAQGLALSKTTTISIVMSEKLLAYNARILNGLMDVANIYHYNIMFHTTSKGISKMQDVIESIIKSRVDGVILFNDNFAEQEMEVLNEYNIPMVIVGSKFEGNKHDKVGNVYVDFEKLAYNLVKDCFKRGIDDIALMEDKLNLSMMNQMKRGISKAYEEAGKTFEGYLSYNDTYHTSYEFFSEYLNNHKPHRINIAFRDSQAIAMMNAAREHGYSVPEDLEIITVLDNKYLPMMRPAITAFNIPDYDMGAIAMRILTKMLVDNDQDQEVEKSIEIQATPVERESTKSL